ncbi:hypothetical protein HN587_01040 [Candidatus Woesearchaeota archaeon]|nr:hypothetical protein [Candidatus Woesearchaeota archaeon]
MSLIGRGRPRGSIIRQNIVEILHIVGTGYAYEIYQIYLDIFPKVTMRSIYYHLHKGLTTNEFKIEEVKQETGDYSWGPVTEKTYYCLGSLAEARGILIVKKYFENKKKD